MKQEADTVQRQKKRKKFPIKFLRFFPTLRYFQKKQRKSIMKCDLKVFSLAKTALPDCCLALLDTHTWNASSYMLSALEMEAVGGSKYQRWTARERFQSNWEHTLICFCSESCHTCRWQNHIHSYKLHLPCYCPGLQVIHLFIYILNNLNNSVNNPEIKYSP